MSTSTPARVALMMDDHRHDLRLLREPFLDHRGDFDRTWVGTHHGRPVTVAHTYGDPDDLPPGWIVQYEDDGTTAVGVTLNAALEAEDAMTRRAPKEGAA